VRDPEFPDTYWVNPFGMHFSMITSSDLVRVDHAGDVVEGERAVNGAAVAIHCAVHAARPDVVAAATRTARTARRCRRWT
jgi:ribulose-5-phosphate 4-epimerase/fuculose-1-phosphate aldolase